LTLPHLPDETGVRPRFLLALGKVLSSTGKRPQSGHNHAYRFA